MAQYTGAHHAMWVYLKLREQLLQGFDPFAMIGRRYVDECPACHSVGLWRFHKDHWFCTKDGCGAERPWKLAAVMKGYFQNGLAHVSGKRVQMKSMPRIHYDTPADLLADLGRIWIVLSHREQYLLQRYVEVGSIRALARELSDAKAFGEFWYPRKLDNELRDGRKGIIKKAEDQMVALGLMERWQASPERRRSG